MGKVGKRKIKYFRRKKSKKEYNKMENETLTIKNKVCDRCHENVEQTLKWYPLLNRWLCYSCYIKAGRNDLFDVQGGKHDRR